MTIKHLIRQIKDQGVDISLVGSDLEISYATDEIDGAIIKIIRDNKSDIIEFFKNNSAELEFNIPHVEHQSSYVLSSSQRRLWVLSQFEEGNVAYNVPGVYVFEGALDVFALSESFKALISRHESLRTVFREESSGDVRQYILSAESLDFKLGYEDFRVEANSKEVVSDLVSRDSGFVFDLSTGPLVRANVYQVSDSRYVFSYVLHHIISDGWTMEILMKELLVLYNSIQRGEANPLEPLRIQYKDYAHWQQLQLSGDSLQRHRLYWLEQFNGDLPVLELPTDRVRPVVKSYVGGITYKRLTKDVTQKLKLFVQAEGSTLFMGLLAAVNSLFYRYTGQSDIVIGSPIAGREHADLHDQIGFYVNTLALRTRFSGTDSYRNLLSNIRQLTLDAYEHQVYPFDELVEELNLKRDMSRNALFDVMLVLQNTELHNKTRDEALAGLRIGGYEGSDRNTSKFDLTLNVMDQGPDLYIGWEYNNDIYNKETIDRFGDHLEGLLQSLLSFPDLSIESLDYLSAAAKHKLQKEFNDTKSDYPRDRTVIDLFEEQVAKTPDAIALVFEETRLTYRALNEQTNQLARCLLAKESLSLGDSVGVFMERSQWSVISMISIMKLGCIYVPIDKALPASRVEHILQESDTKLVLVDDDSVFFNCAAIHKIENLVLETEDAGNLAVPIAQECSCFTIYTSGSTGLPKGVEQVHLMLYNLILWDINAAKMQVKTKHLQFSSYSFDSSIHDVYYTLSTGGEIHVLNEFLRKDLWALKDYILAREISTLSMPYAALKAMFSEIPVAAFSGHSITEIISTGEQLYVSGGLKEFLKNYPAVFIYNLYGPSETHVVTGIRYRYEEGIVPEKASIGKPISNSSIFILDTHQRLVPEGVVGEIYIGGWNLAKGYQNREDLTAEKFVNNPFDLGTRMYRSGDLGRWLSDGTIDYLGRIDDQVKVRGYRIELGEIEIALKKHEGIEDALVVTKKDKEGNQDLVAYLLTPQSFTTGELRIYLSKILPDYMVPSYYVLLDKFPLTANGKIDKRALPDPEGLGIVTGIEYVAPRNEVEEKLVQIWEEILGKDRVGVYDNFFDLGGHSLKLTRLVSRIHKAFEVKLPLRDLFTHIVLSEQALLIGRSQSTSYSFIPNIEDQSSYVLSSSQRRLWVLSQFEEGNVAYNVPGVYVFEGALDREALENSFRQLILRHESLRTVFREDSSGDVRQYILSEEALNVKLGYEDFREEENCKEVVSALVNRDFGFVFDLAEGPLVRANVYQVSDSRYVFSYVLHHIISDGWTMEILMKELLVFYNSIQRGEPSPLAPLHIQYKDYAHWQQLQLSGDSLKIHRSYWLEHFSGDLPVLELPTDRVRPSVKSYKGGVIYKRINKEVTEKLTLFVQEEGSTLFMGLLAAVNSLFYRYTGQSDIVIGSPIAGREHADLHDQIGFYVNTLALRTRFSGTDSYRNLLSNIRQLTLDAYEHQVYPFDELVEELNLKRDMSRNALFDVMLVLQNTELHNRIEQEGLGNISVNGYDGAQVKTSKFDLTFNIVNVGGELQVGLEYNTDIYDQPTVERLGKHLEQLLESLLANPDASIAALSYLDEEENARLLDVLNDTQQDYDQYKTVIDFFESQVVKTPDATAVVFENKQLSYQELNEKSNQLARYLQLEEHLSKGSSIGVMLPRSLESVISMISIMKIGACYVPIDYTYPKSRIDYIVTQSNLELIVSERDILETLALEENGIDLQEINLNKYESSNLCLAIEASDSSFIIYTSGSTGNAKGVVQTHRTLSNLIQWSGSDKGIEKGQKQLQYCSFSFDVSLQDCWSVWSGGGCLYIAEESIRTDFAALLNYIVREKIELLSFPFSAMNQLFLTNDLTAFDGHAIRHIISSGEQLMVNDSLYGFLSDYPGVKLHNHYGPSETHVVTSYTMSVLEHNLKRKAPIGYPISNSSIFILDKNQRLVPEGVVGEIYIGGWNLAKGYQNHPEMTEEKFVENPFRSGELMYRSGDLGKWHLDGSLEYLGRIDDQVKIRGYRIELSEIEVAIKGHNLVKDAIVITTTDHEGNKDLVAYVKSSQELTVSELRVYLSKLLPDYMLPSYYIQMEHFPLTSNGKIDKRSLPDPTGLELSTGVQYIAARNELEAKLVKIWEEILGKDHIGVKDNFFDLGGHSLKLTRLVARIHKEFEVKLYLRDLFTHVTLEEQAVLLAKSELSIYRRIPVVAKSESYVLSSSQRRLWVLSQFAEGNVAYNIAGVYVFGESLDVGSLELSFRSLILRHEILRTVFKESDGGEVRQYVLEADSLDFRLNYEDLRGLDNQDLRLRELVDRDYNFVFDLSSGPLLQASVYQLREDRYVFTYVLHHIISDGWTMDILMKELLSLYNSIIKGDSNPLPPLRIQYKDYAHWQQNQLEGSLLNEHRSYWLHQFRGDLPVLELPTDSVRPVVMSYRGGLVYKKIKKEITQELKSFVQEGNGTLFMGLLAALNSLLYRYTGQSDTIVGSPIAGREHADLHDQIGFYVNTLALRTQFQGTDSFKELFSKTRQLTLDAYEHQVYPFDELVKDLQLTRDLSRNALFDVMLVLQNTELYNRMDGDGIGKINVDGYDSVEVKTSKFDLTLSFFEQAECLQLSLEYNSDIYERVTIERLGNHLEQLLESLLANPNSSIATLPYLREEERMTLLDGFNNINSEYTKESTLIDLFEEQVLKTPGRTAIVYGDCLLSYQDLNERSNQLAHYIKNTYEIKGNDLVGIMLERSEDVIIGILGILKSGGAYVPIDLSYPEERISYMIEDSKFKLLLDENEWSKFKAEDYPKENLAIKIQPKDLAYVIYTSGSTGRPKGVMIEHRSICHTIQSSVAIFELKEGDKHLQFSSYSFDASVWEIFNALTAGCCLYIINEEARKNPSLVEAYIQDNEIDVAFLPPAIFNALKVEKLKPLKKLITGGDIAVVEKTLKYVKQGGSFYNAYGPTESSICATIYKITSDEGISNRSIPIGMPLSNSNIYILDSNLGLQPVGVAGEICIGGKSLARGYQNQKDLTAEKFIAHPFREGELLYKTGDRGRWLSDGNMEYLGRLDDQVKIRGYRIELGEIELSLKNHELIEDAIVITKTDQDGNKDLVAYVISSSVLTASDLRVYLSKTLPDYMIPGYYIPLDKFPLTSNGKIDKNSLPDPEGLSLVAGVSYVAPSNEIEEKLVRIWEEILGKERIGVYDNFFDLGGHSLKLTRLASKIHKEFDVKIELRDLFTHVVVKEQSILLSNSEFTIYERIPAIEQSESYVLSSSQRRLWILNQFEEGSVAYNIPGVYVFEGALNIDCLEKSFLLLIARHEILRTVFREDDSGEVRQYVIGTESLDFRLGYADLRNFPDQDSGLKELVGRDYGFLFDLKSGPLLRGNVYQLTAQKYVFTYVLHHIISDGWTMEILVKELLSLYNSLLKGIENPLRPLRIQYKDYAHWQQAQLEGASLNAHRAYWLNQFRGELPVLELPADKVRPLVKSYKGDVVHSKIKKEVARSLKTFVQHENGTLFMGLLAAINSLFYRYTGQTDMIVGSPIAGREHADLHEQIGFYVNTLALRSQFEGADSFRSLFSHVRKMTLDAYEHQVYPFDQLVEELALKRNLSRSALFDVMLILQNTELHNNSLDNGLEDVNVQVYEGARINISKFDLTLSVFDAGDELQISYQYNSDIYNHSTITALNGHLEQLIESLVAHPDQSIRDLEYLKKEEKAKLLTQSKLIKANDSKAKTIVDLFEEQVKSTPDSIALVFENVQLTYRELNERANQLANYLIEEYKIQTDDLIGIHLERSEWIIISILGVLKSGGAYVPIDIEYPADRIDYMINDSNCRLVIDNENISLFLQTGQKYTKDNLALEINSHDLVYVIYTSGSTGMPKGVMIHHQALVDYSSGIINYTNVSTCKTFGLLSTAGADLGNTVIYTSLVMGGCLHVFSKDDVVNLEILSNSNLDCVKITPSHWKSLQEENGLFVPNKSLIFGGEQLTGDIIASLKDHQVDCAIYNHYGPTETTIGKLIYAIDRNADRKSKIPLGFPFCNSSVYVLDHSLNLQPIGIVGEICIGGVGVARGYINQPALTKDKFVPNPFEEGDRIYRTGDLGRRLEDGSIEYLGRIDDQVKIRGFRIELGEIESCLKKHEGVEDAVVITINNDSGEKDLVAYIASRSSLEIPILRSYLSKYLPDYMIPGYYVQLEKLPLTENGKVNKRALPNFKVSGMAIGVEHIAARNETEERLIKIWEKVLDKNNIGVKDNFFDLGGHSLKATRLASFIHKEFRAKIVLRDLFLWPVLEDQAVLIQKTLKTDYQVIPLAPLSKDYLLSSSQHRLWILSQFEHSNFAYNMPGLYMFEGDLAIDALNHSFNTLLERHEILRTVFREDESGEIRQVIRAVKDSGFVITYHDFQTEVNKDLVKDLVNKELNKSFNLSDGPLIRANVYQLEKERYLFAYVMHHIISDGWSMNILIKELLELYNACVKGEDSPLKPLRIQYKDYAFWQQKKLSAGLLQAHRSYWLNQFAGDLPVLDLPSDKLRPAVKTYNGESVYCRIDKEVSSNFKKLMKDEGCTLFMGLLSSFNVLLYRYTGQEDIIIGSPIAGREHVDLHDQIGFYVNTLALRSRFKSTDSYLELLSNVKQITLDAYEHQIYPFDELVEDLNLRRDVSRSALFDVMLVLHNTNTNVALDSLIGLHVNRFESSHKINSKFDLTVNVMDVGEELHLALEFNSDIYTENSIKRLGNHFSQLLASVFSNKQIPISKLDYLNEQERNQLDKFNDSYADYPRNKNLIELVELQVKKTPNAVATIFGENSLTYEELNERSNQLAHYLRAQYAIAPNDLIGIMLSRSNQMIIALLAILKSGAAYVPIDPSYPEERISNIIRHSNIRVLISEKSLIHDIDRIAGVIDINDDCYCSFSIQNPAVISKPTDLAYVIYTSGTTGNPKGVMVENKSIVNLITAQIKAYGISESENILQFSNICFDASVEQIFVSLISGCTLVLVSNDVIQAPEKLGDFIDTYAISHLHAVPSILRFIEFHKHPSLKRIVSGGDLCVMSISDSCDPMQDFYNEYGPTETSVTSVMVKYEGGTLNKKSDLVIGMPLSNTQIHILDQDKQILPIGILGEIYIGGEGLARGYLNNPTLTAEKFIEHPFKEGMRLYQTGDIGRWMEDGNIEFWGRKDNQVKIRGFRIDLAEIEEFLLRQEDIAQAIVVSQSAIDGESTDLVAYLISEKVLDAKALRNNLKKSLPEYMIPNYFVQMESFPLNANGKVDRKKMPRTNEVGLIATLEYVAPRNDVESILVGMWEQILDRDKISVEDSFFELGGNSLRMIKLFNKLKEQYPDCINIADLYQYATISELSVFIIGKLNQHTTDTIEELEY